MTSLQEIISHKRKEVEERKNRYFRERKTFAVKNARTGNRFLKALNMKHPAPKIIAEIKPSSPSSGSLFREGDSVESIAALYSSFGVSAISVLTDERFFGGSLSNLRETKVHAKHIPLLMKDFLVDEIQIYEAREYGADAVLLMKSVLSLREIEHFLSVSRELGLDAIVEVHDEKELQDICEYTSAAIIGINNRDLSTFEIVPHAYRDLSMTIPEERRKHLVLIAESGYGSREDIRKNAPGADAVLIGSSILTSSERAKTLFDILSVPRIKVCGITTDEDALFLSRQSDYLGFVFAEESPRFVSGKTARHIISRLSETMNEKRPKYAGVFVNPSLVVLDESRFLDVFQLHGNESPEYVAELKAKFPGKIIWKAIRIRSEGDLENIPRYSAADAVLLDAYSKDSSGGTGKSIPSSLLAKIPQYLDKEQKFGIAGGLSVSNIRKVIGACLPDFIDISSSLESSPGKKDSSRGDEFFSVMNALFPQRRIASER